MRLDIPVTPAYERAGALAPQQQKTLQLYLLPAIDELPHTAKRPMVIVLPGGGYHFTCPREAEPIAMKFLAAGMHAAVLNYSVAPSQYPVAALEAAWCVRECRQNAEIWSIDPDAIYLLGFSAGGHLCATVGTIWNDPVFHQALGGGASWRPDAQVLCYPVITMGKFTHEGSRDNLLGENAPAERLHDFSMENRVTAETVPTFLWSTTTDAAVPVENTLQYAAALQKAKVPFEMHVYEKGPHGAATCERHTSVSEEGISADNATWVEHAIRFLQRRK